MLPKIIQAEGVVYIERLHLLHKYKAGNYLMSTLFPSFVRVGMCLDFMFFFFFFCSLSLSLSLLLFFFLVEGDLLLHTCSICLLALVDCFSRKAGFIGNLCVIWQ